MLKGELIPGGVSGVGEASGSAPIKDLRLHIGANEGEFIEIDMREINVTVGTGSGQLNLIDGNSIIELDKNDSGVAIGFKIGGRI